MRKVVARFAVVAIGAFSLMALYGGCGGGTSGTSTFLCGAGSINTNFTNPVGATDLDTSAFSGNDVSATSGSGNTTVTTKICNAPKLRAFEFHLLGALANGQVYNVAATESNANTFMEYTQTDTVNGGTVPAQWIADSGTITVNTVTSTGFTYSFNVHFVPHTINGITQAQGSFDASGTGEVDQFTY